MDKKIIALSSLLFISVALFSGLVIFEKPLSRLISAREELIPSGQNSLVFAWPLKLAADGDSSSIVTIFIRNAEGKPLENKTVTASTSLGNLSNNLSVSDKEGKTVFQLTSSEPGIAEIEATIDNTYKIDQKLTVKFE